MIIKVKCKKCDKEQYIKFENIERNMNYKCQNCQSYMSDRDSCKFSNLLELDSFEILGMYESNNSTYYEGFEDGIACIKEVFVNSPEELKGMILLSIENMASILKHHDSEYTTMLHNSIHTCFLETVDKENSKVANLLDIEDSEK